MDTKIIEKDNRHPVTVALAFAIRENLANAAQLASWKQEMESLVEEITKKFVSFFAKGSVVKGLELTLGILSLSVVHSTKGSYDPKGWAIFLLEHGPKKLAELTISLAKEMAKKPFSDTLEPDKDLRGAKEILLHLAQKKDSQNVWCGYLAYQHDRLVQEEAEKPLRALRWLLKKYRSDVTIELYVEKVRGNITVTRDRLFDEFGRIKKGLEPGISDKIDDLLPYAEQLVNSIMYCVCVGKEVPKDLVLSTSELAYYRRQYEKNPKGWLEKCSCRYMKLKSEVPEALRYIFFVRMDREDDRSATLDWFKHHFQKRGPINIKEGMHGEWNKGTHDAQVFCAAVLK